MEPVPGHPQCRELGIAYFDRGLIVVRVQCRLHHQAGTRPRAGDQLDDGLAAVQRPAAPVLRDEAEQAVLDLVPLARAGREVADDDLQARLVSQALQLDAPQPGAGAV